MMLVKAVQDPSFLSDVFFDLLVHGSKGWYWEEASQFLLLIVKSLAC